MQTQCVKKSIELLQYMPYSIHYYAAKETNEKQQQQQQQQQQEEMFTLSRVLTFCIKSFLSGSARSP